MLKERRLEAISNELERNGIVSINELSNKLNTSRSTICRDIKDLELMNSVKRIRGGAVYTRAKTSYEPPFDVRQDLFLEEKKRIAMAAHNLVNSNETLLLGGGTSIHELAITLNDIEPLYIATNDLMSAVTLSSYPNVDLMVLGGSLRRNHYSLHGYFTETMIKQIHADKAFIGVDAVDLNIGLMNFSTDEIKVNKLLIESSNEVIVLCDHSKFDKIAFVNICQFGDIDLLITGKEVSQEKLSALKDLGVKVMVV